MPSRIVLPGWLWIVILAGIPAFASWLTQWFGASEWAGPVAGLLYGAVGVAKLIFEWQQGPDDKPLPPMPPGELSSDGGQVPTATLVHDPAPERSLLSRVVIG